MSTSTEPKWRGVFVKEHDGHRMVTRSAVVDGKRLYEETTWKLPTNEGHELEQVPELTCYWSTDRAVNHSTWQAALAATTTPVESNTP